jgi:hypothetical protein
MATQYTAGLTQGQKLTADIMNQIGAAWETWTPTVTQSGTFTFTNNISRYTRVNKLVIATTYVQFTNNAGVAGNAVNMSIPIAAQSNSGQMMAFGFIYDSSANTLYNVTAQTTVNASTIAFYQGMATGGSLFGVVPNLALATSDQMRITIIYEAA